MRKKTVIKSKISEKAKKKKGFTLIEVIAVIVIIAVLAIITVPAISNYIGNSKENTYVAYEKNMKTATNNLVVDCVANNDYTCGLPGEGDRSIIYLNDIIEKGYSDELKDPETEGFCNSLLSYVEVNKTGGDYEFKACLYCENYATEDAACSKYESDSDNPVCGSVVGESTTWTNENRTVSVGCSDETSGCRLPRFSKTFGTTTTESFINVVDKSGNQTSCPVKVYVDKTPPTCTLVREGGNLEALGWYSGDVNVKFESKEDANSGILTYGLGTSIKNIDYNKKDSIKLEMGLTTVVGYVKDEAGNEGICSLDVRVGVPKPEFDVDYAYQIFPNHSEYYLSGLTLSGTTFTTTSTNPVLTLGNPIHPVYNGAKKLIITLNSNIQTTTTGKVIYTDHTGTEHSSSALMIAETNKVEFILPLSGQYMNFKVVLGTLSGRTYNISRIDLVLDGPGIWTKNNVMVNLVPRGGLVRTTHYSFDNGSSWQTTNSRIYSSNITNSQVRTRNVVGLSSDPVGVTIARIDKTPPTVNYSLPTGVYSANQTLTITASDNLSGIDNMTIKMERNGVAVGGQTSISGSTYTLNLPGGVYTVYTKVVDKAGNIITQTPNSNGWFHQTITADNQPPTCINSGGSATWKTTDVTITGTCNDADSGCRNATVTKDYKSNINSSNESPGVICDNADNCTTCQADQIVRIDKNAPVISDAFSGSPLFKDPTFASGTNGFGIYNNNGNGTVTHARVAQSNPYGSYVMRITTNGLSMPGLGGYVQSVNSRANAVYVHRIIAKIPVGYTIQRASNETGNGANYYWITSQEGTGDWQEYIYVHKTGSTGNFSNLGHVYLTGAGTSVTWDVAFSTIIDTKQDGVSSTILFTGTDTNSGIIGYGINNSSTTQPAFTAISARTSFGIGVPNIATDNGTYYVWVKDQAGHVTNRAVVVDTIDKTAPTCVSSGGSTSWSQTAMNIIGTCSDSGSGCVNTTITKPYTSDINTNTAGPGEVCDKAGNCVTCPNNQIVKIDGTKPSKPTINLGSYTSGTWTTGNVTIAASSSDGTGSGIASYQYSHDNSNWTALTNPWTINWDGNWNFYVRSIDGAGNISTSSDMFTIKRDATKPSKPTLTMKKADGTTYASNTWSTQNILITASSTDANLARYEYSTTGTSGWTTMPNPWTINWDTSTNIYVRAVDAIGNISDNSNVVVVKRDGTAPSKPTINLGSYTSGNWTKSNVTIAASSSDGTGSGIASYQYSHDASNWTALSNPWTINWDGNWNFYVRSIDVAGNASVASNVFTIRRDTVLPTCKATKSGNGANGISVTISNSENVSGIVSATYSDSNVKGTKTYYVTDGAGNTGSCSITSSCITNVYCQHADCGYNSCLSGSPSVCAGGNNSCYTAGCGCTGNKRCTSYSCCGTYCKTKGNIYECYQNTGGYGCGTKCASSKPSSGGQTWYKSSTTCCVSGEEAATCYKDCCGCAGYYYCQHSACGWNNCLYTYSTCVGGNNSCRTAACGCENWG